MKWRHENWTLVDTPEAFEDMLQHLNQAPCLAVDTEANGLYAYREQVTLIQISTPDYDFIVDPLAPIPLSALGSILAAKSVEKVFHAAEYDLIGLYRDFGWRVVSLFDTMHAARLLGKRHVGLAALLEAYFGVRLSKRYQRANWGRRPLSQEMLRYARADTHFLVPLRDLLEKELRRRGLWELAQEDFARLENVRLPHREFDPQGFWRLPGASALPRNRWAVLQALYLWREQEAQRRNVPPFRVLSNRALVQLARTAPATVNALQRVLPTGERVPKAAARELLKIIAAAQQRPAPEPPSSPPPPQYRDRVERLRAWRRHTAIAEGIPSDMVLPREAMIAIARANPATLEELKALDVLGPVRLERYGERILQALKRT